RWPSYTVVSQGRWFSTMTAQIRAAAAALLSGPSPSLNCIPGPVLFSLIMIMGCNAANGALDRDLSRPRHSARKPPSEFAPPTSTANSVFCTSTLGGVDGAASAFSVSGFPLAGTAATTVRAGVGVAAAMAPNSGAVGFPAEASAGAGSDFEAVDGTTGTSASAGLLGVPCSADIGAVGFGRGGPASATGFSAGFSVAFTGVTGATEGSAGSGGAAGALVATAAGAGGGAGAATGGGAATAAFCRVIAPVTESSPCSSTVTREYSLSRSPLSVSIADASRRVSFWPSLATDRICCSCRARSAAATSSCDHPIEDWLVYRATATALTATAPQDASLNSVRRSKSSSSAKSPAGAPPELSASKLPARWMGSLAMEILRPPTARRITPRT